MMDTILQETTLRDIKYNCDVSDAQFWGNFSICGLLMRYRDLFRSEKGLEPWDPINREEIGPWITEKESRWPELEQAGFREIRVRGSRFQPFDATGINRVLEAEGYVYGAGYGMYLKPTFFLAELLSSGEEEDHRVYVTGRETVRDLFAAPAMLQGRTIVLRNDPLKALLWEKYSQLRAGDDSVLAEAFAAQGLPPGRPVNAGFAAHMETIAVSYRAVLLRHEFAESAVSAFGWTDILPMLDHRGAEHFLRAVQDLIADTSDRGPIRFLTERQDIPSLFLYAGLLEGYRRLLFPEIRDILSLLRTRPDWQTVDQMRRTAHEKYLALRARILELRKRGGRAELLAGILELSRKAA